MKRLLIIIAITLGLGFAFGTGTGYELPHFNAAPAVSTSGFTSGELELLNNEIPSIEAQTSLKNVTVKPLAVVEVPNDREAIFEVDGDLNGSPIKLIGSIEHYRNLPDSIGPLQDSQGQPLIVISNKYEAGATTNGG